MHAGHAAIGAMIDRRTFLSAGAAGLAGLTAALNA